MVKYDFEKARLEFSIGGFIGVIATILTLVLGFYSYVISPKFDVMNEKINENKAELTDTKKDIVEIKTNITEIKTIVLEMKQTKKE